MTDRRSLKVIPTVYRSGSRAFHPAKPGRWRRPRSDAAGFPAIRHSGKMRMRLAGWLAGRLTGAAAGRALAPAGAWDLLRTNQVRMLDLRTGMERSRYGWPPGARPVSLLRHAVSPDRSAVYLCQHAVRSKL